MNTGVEPRVLETERCILGIALMRSSLLLDINNVVSPDDFYDEKHRKIFQKMLDMRAKGEDVSSIALLEAGIVDQGDLVNLMDDTVIPELWMSRCKSLKQYSIRRKLVRISHHIEKRAKDPSWEVTGANVMAMSNAVTELCPPEALSSDMNPFTGLSRYAQSLREMGGIRFGTGLSSFDRHMAGGVLPGESMNIVGAEGSMKTALAIGGAKDYIRRSRRKVIYFCIDPSMSGDAIRNRLLQAELNMDNKDLIESIMNESPLLLQANDRLNKMYGDWLLVKEGPQSIDSIARMVEKERPGAVIYDYFSSLSGFKNDYDLANVAMTELNELGKKYKFSNIFLHQMSRESKLDQRKGNFGNHAKGGGAAEERVHVEIELASYNALPSEPELAHARLIAFTKNRNGCKGTYIVKTIPHAMVFLDDIIVADFNSGKRTQEQGWRPRSNDEY